MNEMRHNPSRRRAWFFQRRCACLILFVFHPGETWRIAKKSSALVQLQEQHEFVELAPKAARRRLL